MSREPEVEGRGSDAIIFVGVSWKVSSTSTGPEVMYDVGVVGVGMPVSVVVLAMELSPNGKLAFAEDEHPVSG